jgi:hypothetical protein
MTEQRRRGRLSSGGAGDGAAAARATERWRSRVRCGRDGGRRGWRWEDLFVQVKKGRGRFAKKIVRRLFMDGGSSI